jgi:5-methylcytosine-specific restriction protein A
MPKLRILGPIVRALDTSTTKLPPKQAESVYGTPQYRAWRAQIVVRAGARCEAMDNHWRRCPNAWPEHRMYADHVVELRDGGKAFDINNGQCLCRSHHELKTIAARVKRYQC